MPMGSATLISERVRPWLDATLSSDKIAKDQIDCAKTHLLLFWAINKFRKVGSNGDGGYFLQMH